MVYDTMIYSLAASQAAYFDTQVQDNSAAWEAKADNDPGLLIVLACGMPKLTD